MSADGVQVRIVSGSEKLQAANAVVEAKKARDEATAALLRVIWLLLWVCSPALVLLAYRAAL